MGNFIKWLYLVLLPIVLANDYCSVCNDHTMCRFMQKNPACGKNSESGVSPAEAKQIVDLHNAYRAKIANGQETRGKLGPQPPAGNMQALIWDDKLAEVAQRWADQCTFKPDKCRDDPRFEVGQNIYLSSGFSTVDWARAINSWYNEVDDFSSKDVNSFKPNPKTGRFSQIAWATTTHIGCGRMSYNAAYRPYGQVPQEFVLSAISARNNTAKDEIIEDDKTGFFGGAIYDSSGARGAITSFSKEKFTGNTGLLNGNRPSTNFGENFFSNGIISNMQKNPGFFGGATFNPEGALGAITSTSAEKVTGNAGLLNGNRPSTNFGENFFGNGIISNMQKNPGFFGGASFNPEGVLGAITSTSAGDSGSTESLSGNRPSTNFGENFFSNGIISNIQKNPGFFGDATFNPEGALGAITSTSAEDSGSTGSLSGNRPSTNFFENFFSNGIGGNMQKNPGFFGGAMFNPKGALGAITASYPNYPGSNRNHLTNENDPNYPNYHSSEKGQYYPLYAKFLEDYLRSYSLNSGSYSKSYGNSFMNIPAGFVRVENRDLTHHKSSNVWIPSHLNLVGKDQILICNYGPSGNWEGKSLYIKGESCSKCPTGTICKSGLCVTS